jgi:biopolymer transport protein ExbB
MSLHPFDWSEALPQVTQKQLDAVFTSLQAGKESTILFPADILLQQNLTKAYTEEEKRPFFTRILAAIKKGGVFMAPILTVPFIALLLILLKLGHLMGGWRGRNPAWLALEKLEKGDKTSAQKLEEKNGLLALAIKVVGQAAGKGRSSAEQSLQELFLKATPKLERHLTTLSVLAATAPLLGLLGTVSGLLAMFTVLTEQGVNDPKLLAGGIAEALITTEAGLIVAIPILFAHNWLSNRVEALIQEAEYAGQKAMNLLWPQD